MKNQWKVDFYDNDDEKMQIASFMSKLDAENWIKCQAEQQQYDPTGFEVVAGPYVVKGLWFDRKRSAPEGFIQMKSVKDFVDDYVPSVNKKLDDIVVISLDTDNDVDGHSFDDIISYFSNNGIKSIKVNVHGNDDAKKTDMLDHAKIEGMSIIDELDEDEHDEYSLDENDSNDPLSFKSLKNFAESINVEDSAQGIIDAMIVFISRAFDVDPQKFVDENEWLVKKLRSLVALAQNKIDFAAPIMAIKYPSTDVSLLLVADFPSFKDKSFKGLMTSMGKTFNTVFRPGRNVMLLPFKIEDGKVMHDTSENAYMQLAMTYLLSDIEFDMIWPIKAHIQPLMKYLDYICPSIMDVISLATLGGASVASRAVKISAKVGAKKAAKGTAKKGIKKLSQKQLKLIAKISKKAPKNVQKAVKRGHKAIKKAKEASKISRKMKDNLKNGNEPIQENELNVLTGQIKIWVDDIRPAPEGYVWLKSVNDFIDFMIEHRIQDIAVLDFDHDAGEYAKDGGDYIKCLDWLESVGADNINVRIHSSNPVGVQKMRQIIQKNQWNEVHDILEEDDECSSKEFDQEEQIQEEDEELNEQEDSAKKDSIIKVLKKASKDFQDAASNHDPSQFSKIVVAFDDLMSGVGAYDFKKKKVLKEDEKNNDNSSDVED